MKTVALEKAREAQRLGQEILRTQDEIHDLRAKVGKMEWDVQRRREELEFLAEKEEEKKKMIEALNKDGRREAFLEEITEVCRKYGLVIDTGVWGGDMDVSQEDVGDSRYQSDEDGSHLVLVKGDA